MFTRLKKKIETESASLVPADLAGKNSQNRRDSVTSLPRAGSFQHLGPSPPGSIISEDISIRDVSSPREDYAIMLQRKTEQCKKLEGNISELAALIKDKSKTIEKLELAIKQHEDVTQKKLQEQKEEFERYRDKLIEGYQTDKLKLNKEKTKLVEKLASAEKYRDRFFKKEAEIDEFEGMAKQELSKIKHLLIITEEALNACRQELDSKTQQCLAAETQVEKLTEELSPLKQRLSLLESENLKLREETTERADLVISLSKDKAAFDKRLDEMNKEMLEKQSQLSKLQEQLAYLDSDYKTLIRNSDLQRNKSNKQLEEKDDEIDRLQERVKVLQQRLADSGLSGDERTTAINAEREALENKLAEARQQLTEVKSTWSDKISQLEHQISNLNAKIVEDSEELSNNQKFTEQMRINFNKQIEDLHAKLEDAENRALENLELISSKSFHYEKQIGELERQLVNQQANITLLENNISEIEAENQKICATYQQDIADTSNQVKDFKSKETKLLDEIQSLNNEINRLLSQCSDKDVQIQFLREQVQQSDTEAGHHSNTITSLQQQLADQEHISEKLKSDKVELEKKLQSAWSEKSGLQDRITELLGQIHELESSKSELQLDFDQNLEAKSEIIESLQKIEAGLRHKLDSLEKQIELSEISKAESGLYSSRIDEMSETITSLQAQLADKNKTLKKQEQTLKDLRTTLQRELKIQTIPNDDFLDQTANNTVTSSSPSLLRKHDVYQSQQQQQNQISIPRNSAANSHASPAVLTLQTSSSNMLTVTSTSSSIAGTSHDALAAHSSHVKRELDKDINFLYLKHVVLKFMLSRESEALQLIKAVSMLLNFTHQEQQLIKDTLEWKMSWFGHRPPLGKGPTSKVIPPTL